MRRTTARKGPPLRCTPPPHQASPARPLTAGRPHCAPPPWRCCAPRQQAPAAHQAPLPGLPHSTPGLTAGRPPRAPPPWQCCAPHRTPCACPARALRSGACGRQAHAAAQQALTGRHAQLARCAAGRAGGKDGNRQRLTRCRPARCAHMGVHAQLAGRGAGRPAGVRRAGAGAQGREALPSASAGSMHACSRRGTRWPATFLRQPPCIQLPTHRSCRTPLRRRGARSW